MKKIILLISIVLLSSPLFGAVSTDNQAQDVLAIFESATTKWNSIIIPAALFIFWSLVTIDFVITFGYMAIKGTDFGELFYELIRKILIIGFFLFLFVTVDLMKNIPTSFSKLANQSTGVDIEPDTILEQAFLIVESIWDGISMWSPGDSLGLVIAGIIILIAFALMSATLFVVIVKLYALISAAYLVYSLGGLSFTRSYAVNPIISIIKAGLELFFIKLFLGLSVGTVKDMAANVGTDNNSIMAMIAIAVLLASLVQMTGSMADSLLSGHMAGTSTSGIGTAKATFAAAAGAGIGAVAGSIAGNSAINAAKELSSAGQGSTLGNLAKAAGTDAINTITGANKYAAGNMGVRMSNSMMGQADTLNNAKDLSSTTQGATSNSQKSMFNQANDLMGSIKKANDFSSSSNKDNSEYISNVNEENFNKGQL